MTITQPVVDSPNPWVADHIRRFQETAGRPRPGFSDLLLTTRGRRSGQLRRTALAVRGLSGRDAPGDPTHPRHAYGLRPPQQVQRRPGAGAAPAPARDHRSQSQLHWCLMT